nr:hypothetical protein CFP56_13316 [Quercus suber]
MKKPPELRLPPHLPGHVPPSIRPVVIRRVVVKVLARDPRVPALAAARRAVHAAVRGLAPDVEVEEQGGERGETAEERKGEERFVDPADHDLGVGVGVGVVINGRAAAGDGAAGVPCQRAPAEGPEEGEEAVDHEVEVWVKAGAPMEHDGECQGRDGEDGCGHELDTARSGFRDGSCADAAEHVPANIPR